MVLMVLIFGIADEKLSDHLLLDYDLMEIAITVIPHSKGVQNEKADSLAQLRMYPIQPNKVCGKRSFHHRSLRPAKNVECHVFQKVVHYSSVCRSKSYIRTLYFESLSELHPPHYITQTWVWWFGYIPKATGDSNAMSTQRQLEFPMNDTRSLMGLCIPNCAVALVECRPYLTMAAEQQENIKFAQFIEQFVCLYDHNNKSYSNRVVTDKAWQAVADEFKLTVKQCKEKWKNIRTVFRRHIFTKPVSGAGGSSKKEYYLADVLQYLVPILKGNPKNIGSNLPPPPETDDHQQQTLQEEEPADYSINEIADDVDDDATELPQEAVPNVPEPANNSISQFRKKQLGKRKPTTSPLDEAMTNYFKAKSMKPAEDKLVPVADNEDKSDELFLLSLKKDMKEMNSRQKRTFKRRIFSLIDEVLDDSPGKQTHDMYSSSSLQSSRSPSVLTNIISPGNPGQENEEYVFNTLTNAFGIH
ncbi:hypothetical protein J6590_098281 [Homalodisca vitripennis]|nr:hypothetical protein J6590_098281 [Homalodisca vitripennis]